MAAGANPANISRPSSRVMRIAKCPDSRAMSSARTRSAGTPITSKASRSSRSARKTPRPHQRRQVGMGGGDHPHIDPLRLAAADPLEAAILDHTQQLLLHRHRRGGDLVQEQGAAIGELEPPRTAPLRPGEGACLVAEQLAIEQRIAQHGAVQLDERPFPARREEGKTACHQLLSGATFADHQHRPVERGCLRDMRQHLAKQRRLAQRGRRLLGQCG